MLCERKFKQVSVCASGRVRGLNARLAMETDETSSLRSLRTLRTVSSRGICSRMSETTKQGETCQSSVGGAGTSRANSLCMKMSDRFCAASRTFRYSESGLWTRLNSRRIVPR